MPYIQLKTSDGKNFLTSAAKNFKVFLVTANDTVYHDSIGLAAASMTEGYISGGNFNSQSGNQYLANLTDQAVGPRARFSGSTAAGVRYDLGSNKSMDFMALYVPDQAGGYTMKLHGSTAAASGYTELKSITSPRPGWNVYTFDSGSYRYITFQVEAASIDLELSELMIGASWEPGKIFTSGTGFDIAPGVMLDMSDGGIEWPIQKADSREGYDYILAGIDSSLKSTLENVRDALDGYKKFLWYYDTTTKYVALSNNSLAFKQRAADRWDTKFIMRESNG